MNVADNIMHKKWTCFTMKKNMSDTSNSSFRIKREGGHVQLILMRKRVDGWQIYLMLVLGNTFN
jgi:hypothetical protein